MACDIHATVRSPFRLRDSCRAIRTNLFWTCRTSRSRYPAVQYGWGPDGTISVATSDGSAIAGRVGVFTFGPDALLSAEGRNRYVAPRGAKAMMADARVQQGGVEGSNQDAVHGTVQLMLMQRQAEMMQKALTVFNNEFDKVAAEELSRV